MKRISLIFLLTIFALIFFSSAKRDANAEDSCAIDIPTYDNIKEGETFALIVKNSKPGYSYIADLIFFADSRIIQDQKIIAEQGKSPTFTFLAPKAGDYIIYVEETPPGSLTGKSCGTKPINFKKSETEKPTYKCIRILLKCELCNSSDADCLYLSESACSSVCKIEPQEKIEPIKPARCDPIEGKDQYGGTTVVGYRGIQTALGCIPTDPQQFISLFFKWAVGLAGGIAFILMLFAAFKILMSTGNPETLKAAQEQLTSAIIGLLFIIFSVFLLRIIGLPIMNISSLPLP